jgi:glycine/D-amino acid oxidase-like deaminating enzyme
MTTSKIPVGLPRSNPTNSYWQTPPLPIADHRTTPKLPPSAKYIIVGSGITGATIAWKLFQEEPDASIVMLEARQASSGATGRNGGHCRAGRYLNFADDLKNFGKEDALRLEKLEEENVKNVGEFIKEHGIECDLRDVETVDIWKDLKQWEDTLESLKKRKEMFEGRFEAEVLTKHKIWSKEEAREGLLIPEAEGAVSFPAFALSPYKFVCGLLEMCLKKGMNLQTNTPVVEVSKNSARNEKGWIVYTPRGEIKAEKVILATNAYTAALYPPLADFINPTRGQVAAIRAGSNIAGNPALKRTCGLNSAISGDYMQSRAEGFSGAGDIIIGTLIVSWYCRNRNLTSVC